jgi:hypothetical protein
MTKNIQLICAGDSSTSRKFGHWLGLAIDQLLELMDSKLNLESTYGTGSNFSLQLN